MKKKLLAVFIAVLAAGVCYGLDLTDPPNAAALGKVKQVMAANNVLLEAQVSALQAGVSNGVVAAATVTVTNGGTYTLTENLYMINSIGGAVAATNSCTFLSDVANREVFLYVNPSTAASSNTVLFTDGNLYLGGDIALDETDYIGLLFTTTSNAVKTAHEDN